MHVVFECDEMFIKKAGYSSKSTLDEAFRKHSKEDCNLKPSNLSAMKMLFKIRE
jgi:hypothetical protein